jgi:hypothetical protein
MVEREEAGQKCLKYRAMLMLRQCAVPRMNYLLRCLPPPCIVQQAEAFDAQILHTAKTKLGLHTDEGCNETNRILQAKLRHGGFGLTSAVRTSPAAYLASVAAVGSASAFAAYRKEGCPLPSDALLHGWIDSSLATTIAATPASSEHLPSSTASFFQHFSKPSASSSLQHTLSSQASQHSYQASLNHAHKMKKTDGGASLAHAKATSAPRAWAWKMVVPTTKELELADVQYRMAARLNLRLQPVTGAASLPSDRWAHVLPALRAPALCGTAPAPHRRVCASAHRPAASYTTRSARDQH